MNLVIVVFFIKELVNLRIKDIYMYIFIFMYMILKEYNVKMNLL